MAIQQNIASAREAKDRLLAHCLCYAVAEDDPGCLLVLLPDGYQVDAVRVRGRMRADAYTIAEQKLEQIWKESLEWWK